MKLPIELVHECIFLNVIITTDEDKKANLFNDKIKSFKGKHLFADNYSNRQIKKLTKIVTRMKKEYWESKNPPSMFTMLKQFKIPILDIHVSFFKIRKGEQK